MVVTDFEASRINQVSTSSLLTRTTDQIIWGSLAVDSLTAPDLNPGSVNGLRMREEVAYINSPFPVTSKFMSSIFIFFCSLLEQFLKWFSMLPAPVSFDKFQCRELVLPPTATIASQPIGRRLLNQPKIVYEGSVTIKGKLTVTYFTNF